MRIKGKQGRNWCRGHIDANGIRCRVAEWIGMAANIDLLRIDGKTRYFDINSHREMSRDEVHA